MNQCNGITLKNTRCNRSGSKHNGYCLCHAPQHIQLPNDVWSYIIMILVKEITKESICVTFCVVSKSFNVMMKTLIKPYWFKILRPAKNDRLNDSALICIASAINSLDLYCNDYITDKGLKHLTNLTELKLGYNYTITDWGLRHLINLKSLNIVRNYKITDLGLSLLTNLTFLNMYGNETITDLGIMNLTKLKILHVSSTLDITDKSVVNLKNLTELKLYHAHGITDTSIRTLTNLLNLDINSRTITSYGLEPLTNLTKLTLRGQTSIDPQDLFRLKNIIEYI